MYTLNGWWFLSSSGSYPQVFTVVSIEDYKENNGSMKPCFPSLLLNSILSPAVRENYFLMYYHKVENNHIFLHVIFVKCMFWSFTLMKFSSMTLLCLVLFSLKDGQEVVVSEKIVWIYIGLFAQLPKLGQLSPI